MSTLARPRILFGRQNMSISRLLAVVGFAFLAAATHAADSAAERGKYLVTIAGCGDCHTPGSLLGKPDLTRVLGGSEVGSEVPGAGFSTDRT